MNKKICVYAICKNEGKHIDRWLASLKSADKVVVLDTGSTDDTIVKLKKYEPWVTVEQKIINPWRFDTARNESMKLIPNDTDICVVSDCDQVFRSGWAEVLRERFDQGYEEVWGPIIDYDENGNEEKSFLSRNVHSYDPNWRWDRPVHEGIEYYGDHIPKVITDDRFVIEHHPDRSKSRGQYLDILEREYKENSTDPYCAIYYGCELSFHGKNKESLEVFLKAINECDFSKHPEIGYQINLNIALSYLNDQSNAQAALPYAEAAKNFGLLTRRLYVTNAKVKSTLGDFEGALKELEDARELVPSDNEGWTEDRQWFGPEFDDMLAGVRKQVNKVIVYAICKNEEQHIDRWWDGVKDADAIVVLDTGSTDNTVNKLFEIQAANLYIYNNNYGNNFRFDVARNEALDLARKLGLGPRTIYLSLDFDEFLELDGINKIKANWDSSYDTLTLEGLTEGVGSQLVTHKIHSSDPKWHWIRLVHEIISKEDKKQKEWIVGPVSALYVHEQDLTKKRDYYELLKKEYEEEGPNGKTLTYLAWEAALHSEPKQSAHYASLALDCLYNNESDEFYLDYEYILQNIFYILDAKCGDDDLVNKAQDIIKQNEFPDFRRLRFILASYYWDKEDYESALDQYRLALIIKSPYSGWIDNNDLYHDELVYSDMALCLYKLEFITDAYYFAQKARKLSNEDWIEQNYQFYKQEYENKYIKPEITENKICVYAICRNESQFVDKWYESMKEADEIVVLDTGSTDDTVEKLRSHGVTVKVKEYPTWRFDLARNESMKMVPADCNILVCTDLDEVLEPGWAKILKDNWIETKHKRAYYKYSWSHLPNGESGRVFCYDKFHSRGWTWIFPVHEMLYFPYNDDIGGDAQNDEKLHLFDQIHLHHYPDFSKPRSSYLPLLELRAKENPEDWYGLIYLAHEYYYRGLYQNSIDLLHKILENYSEHYDLLEQASCYLFAGDSYVELQQYDEAIKHYQKAIKLDGSYREPYINLAKVYLEMQQFQSAYDTLITALQKTYRHYTWLERDISWTYEIADLLCLICYWGFNDKATAARFAAKALSYEPENERLMTNFNICMNDLSELDLI